MKRLSVVPLVGGFVVHLLLVGGSLALAQGGAEGEGAPSVGGGPTVHALAAGDPLPTLRRGDEIVLEAGIHVGPWTIATPDVVVRGQGATLDGGGSGDALTLLAPGIRVEGLTITGVGPVADLYAPDAAVAMFGCHACEIVGLRATGITTAVRVEDSEDVRLADFDVAGDGRSPGITAYEAPHLFVDGGHFDAFLDGVYLERTDFSRVQGAIVTGVVRYGLHVMLSLQVNLVDNHVSDGGLGSVVMYGRDSRVEGNTFEGHRQPMAYGLLIQEERLTQLIGNTFRENTLGVLIVSAQGVGLRDNDIDANGVGVLVQRPEPGTVAQTDLTLTGNTFRRNAADVAVDDADAALTLNANAYDRAPLLDLDGDGTVDVPYIATSAFAARAARQPDLTLLSHGPGLALWARLEASVPGVREATFADAAARMVEPHARESADTAATIALAVAVTVVAAAGATGAPEPVGRALAVPFRRLRWRPGRRNAGRRR